MLTWNGPKIVAAIEARAGHAVREVADRVLATAKEFCPVDTGELRDSGHVLPGPEETTAYVVFDAPHAGFVHDGTPRMPARPFLARAALYEQSDALGVFRAVAGAGR